MKTTINALILLSVLTFYHDAFSNSEKPTRKCLREIISNLLIITKPKLGFPSYSKKSFNIKIAGKTIKKSKFNPSLLKTRTINEVNAYAHFLQVFGFEIRPLLQVIVESHPGAVKKLGMLSNKKNWLDN